MLSAAQFLPVVVAGLLTATACDRLPSTSTGRPMPAPISLSRPDPNFRLDTDQRASIVDVFDVDALERLLAHIRPEWRAEILAHFQVPPPGASGRGHLAEFYDPKLQALLEEVWAPLWRDATDEEIERNLYGLPGREAALRQRRAERRRDNGDNTP